jgi:hypothetical protein
MYLRGDHGYDMPMVMRTRRRHNPRFAASAPPDGSSAGNASFGVKPTTIQP